MDNLEPYIESANNSADSLIELATRIVQSYTSDLDAKMSKIQENIKNLSDRELEMYCLEFTNVLYFLGERLESLGIKDDISKALSKEAYNNAYLLAQVKDVEKKNKTTVAETVATAELKSQSEAAVNVLYNRVYKMLKFKIDAAYEMINSIRKVISKRMQDASLSASGTSSRILNE